MNHRLAVLFSVVAMMAVTCSVASISTSRANVEFKIVNQPGVPARLKNFVIENDAGKQISLLHYRVVLEGSSPVGICDSVESLCR